MNYVKPFTEELSVTYNDITYHTEYYQTGTVTGITDESHPDWSSTATYNTGDYVIIPELKKIYRCADDSVTGVFPTSDSTVWVDYGMINSYKMFASDEYIGSQTQGTDMTIEMPFSFADTIAGIDLGFVDAIVEITDNNSSGNVTDENITASHDSAVALTNQGLVNGTVVVTNSGNTTEYILDTDYTIDYMNGTITALSSGSIADGESLLVDYEYGVVYRGSVLGKDIGCLTFAEYFYDEVAIRRRVIMNQLPYLTNGTLKITMSGDAKIGTFVVGLEQNLGVTMMGTSLKFEDNSKIKVDEITGFRTILRRGNLRVLDARVELNVPEFDLISQKIGEILGVNVLWMPTDGDKFSELVTLGYIEDFDMPLDNHVIMDSKARVIGVNR